MAGDVFLGAAHIEQIERALLSLGLKAQERGIIDAPDRETVGNLVGESLRPLEPFGRGRRQRLFAPTRQFEARQFPAHRAVFERQDRVRQPGVAQRLRADDAARPPGAIDDNEGVGRRHPVGHAIDQLGAGTVERAGDAHIAEFADRPAVDDQHLFAGIESSLQFGGGDVRRLAAVLHELAERLAWHIDAGEELIAGGGPTPRAAGHNCDIAVAHTRQRRRGTLGEILVTAVVNDHARALSRHQIADHQLQPRQR